MSGAGQRAADNLAEAPLIALAGGLAAGALIAALLPRTDSETRLVKPTARRVRDGAKAAFDAACTTPAFAAARRTWAQPRQGVREIPCARCFAASPMPPRRRPKPRSTPRATSASAKRI